MRLLLAGIAASLAGACAAGDIRPQQPVPPVGWEKYKIVVQRNIFSKDRGKFSARRGDRDVAERPKSEGPVAPPPPPPPKPEADILLRGTLDKDGKTLAFIENVKTGVTQKLAVGETVGSGKITKITLDGIEFSSGTEGAPPREVKIGMTLDGAAATGAMTAAIPTPAGGATGAPPPAGSEADILERMRRKRQEAMGK